MIEQYSQPRLAEFLGETFEATWRILGEDQFPVLATDYFQSYPSQYVSLFDYGLALPDWVAQSAWLQRTPFLSDLTRFEWDIKEVSHLPQHSSISKEMIQGIDPSLNVRLVIGQACRLFESSFAVFDIWKQCFLGNHRPQLPWARSQRLALYKQDSKMCIRELNEPQFVLLEHLKAGGTVKEALDLALNLVGNISQQTITEFFHMLFQAGLVMEVESLPMNG